MTAWNWRKISFAILIVVLTWFTIVSSTELVGIPVVLILLFVARRARVRAFLGRGARPRCPACAEHVRREATICSRCRSALAPSIGVVLLVAVVATISGCGSTSASSTVTVTVQSTVAATTTVPPPPQSCSTFAASRKPARCLTVVERREIAAKKAAATKRKRIAAKVRAARAAKARRARAAARKEAARKAAVAEAAAEVEANAWHQGYEGPLGENLDVYGRFENQPTCEEFAESGCWKFDVITENGCQYLEVAINEMKDGAIVGNVIANQINVPPKTPVILELDADTVGVEASAPTLTCD